MHVQQHKEVTYETSHLLMMKSRNMICHRWQKGCNRDKWMQLISTLKKIKKNLLNSGLG